MADEVIIMPFREASEMVADVKVADVKSIFENPINEGKVIVVVEGQDDIDVYSKVMDNNAVRFYPDCNCDKHVIILNSLNRKYGNRLLAIKDADFDRLEGRVYSFSNLLLTDSHDLENMIVEECLSELSGDDAERCHSINLTEVYEELEDISYLKWYSHTCHLGINFSDIAVNTDLPSFFTAAVANTNNIVRVTLTDVAAFKNRHQGVPRKELCNGHDLLEVIYARAKAVKTTNYPKRPFFKRFRKAYPRIKFTSTSLFQAIRTWETTNDLSILIVA